MAAPTMTTVGKGGTSADATSLVLTLSAGADVGTAVAVFMARGSSASSVTDSRGNTYTSNTIYGSAQYAWTTVVQVALVATDTITISFASSTCVAIAVDMTGQAMAVSTSSGVGGILSIAAGARTDTSTSLALTGAIVPAAPGSDMLAILVGSISTGAVSGDFSSVDESYSLADTEFTSGTGTQRGIALCTKALSVASPMPSQNPVLTLANSRTWHSGFVYAVAPTARGAVGQEGYLGTATLNKRAALGAPETLGQIKTINGLVQVKTRDGLL